MIRQPAIRVFPYELNRSKVLIKKTKDGRTYNFLLTPLGALVNRVFMVGTIFSKEEITDDLLKVQISNPGSSFYIKAGKFTPGPREKLRKYEEGDFVAVVGKISVFQPEGSNRFLVSITPEEVNKVTNREMVYWIYDTSRKTLMRIRAMRAALDADNPTVDSLMEMGFPRYLAEGVMLALEKYGKDEIRIERFMDIVEKALMYIVPQEALVEKEEVSEEVPAEGVSTAEEEDLESKILAIIQSCDHEGDGARYEDIVSVAEDMGIPKEDFNRVFGELLYNGAIFEVRDGRYKVT